MHPAAVLLPETALLVPGAAGAAEVLAEERKAVVDALQDLMDGGPSHVVVVAAAARSAILSGPLRPSLAAAGIDGARGWQGPVVVGPARDVLEVGPAVALLALHESGWTGRTSVVLVGPEDGAVRAAAAGIERLGPRAGRARREDGGEVGLVLVGSLSARRGPSAPLPEDARAPAIDDAVLRDLLDLGPEACDRLGSFPEALAEELAVSAWRPWQVLVRLAGSDVRRWRGDLRRVSVPFGATCAVVVWEAS